LVARELMVSRFDGEILQSDDEIAKRSGLSASAVRVHIDALVSVRFDRLPHKMDERQEALDRMFTERGSWKGEIRKLRRLFPEWTRFRVAREMFAFCLSEGRQPSGRELTAWETPHLVGHVAVVQHFDAVQGAVLRLVRGAQ
jgi:hypothetical protein